MNEDARRRIIRLAALELMKAEVPGAPAAAIGPPSKWWSSAENVIDRVEPYFREAFLVDNV